MSVPSHIARQAQMMFEPVPPGVLNADQLRRKPLPETQGQPFALCIATILHPYMQPGCGHSPTVTI